MRIKTALPLILLLLISVSKSVFSQNLDTSSAKVDSLKLKTVQEKLEGCWKTKYYQFKYDSSKNYGYEFKSRVHSSAPIFKLTLLNNEVYIEWIELTGGVSQQRILRIKENKLFVEGGDRKRYSYKRSKDCTPLFK